MNYRHEFHAGNAADVLKHLVVIGVLRALARKATPYVYFDTHAGAGLYDLHAPAARKTSEFLTGIGRLWPLRGAPNLPALVADYLALVAAHNPGASLRTYPGSPVLAQAVTRGDDRLILIEQVAEVAAFLKQQCTADARISVHINDGYQGLKALLPPRTRKRGVVLMDPPYEDRNEFAHVGEALLEAIKRWPGGIFLVWYPIAAYSEDAHLLARLRASGVPKILVVEWCWNACRLPKGMNGSGMLIVNPPWQFERDIDSALAWLHPQLAPDPSAGRVRVHWCTPP